MTPVSHALLPVFLGQHWIPQRDRIPNVRTVSIVSLCGVLPDVLSPHLTLDDRHTSLSHTAWAALLFGVVIARLAWRLPKLFPPAFARLCFAAYAGHLACDAITGGIPLFYPISPAVFGKNYLPYWLWITCDGALLLYLYLVYRWLPLRRKLHASKSFQIRS